MGWARIEKGELCTTWQVLFIKGSCYRTNTADPLVPAGSASLQQLLILNVKPSDFGMFFTVGLF